MPPASPTREQLYGRTGIPSPVTYVVISISLALHSFLILSGCGLWRTKNARMRVGQSARDPGKLIRYPRVLTCWNVDEQSAKATGSKLRNQAPKTSWSRTSYAAPQQEKERMTHLIEVGVLVLDFSEVRGHVGARDAGVYETRSCRRVRQDTKSTGMRKHLSQQNGRGRSLPFKSVWRCKNNQIVFCPAQNVSSAKLVGKSNHQSRPLSCQRQTCGKETADSSL